jgi:hypothetical protein
MGQVKNVVDNVDRAAVNPEKRKLGVGTDEKVKLTAQVREGFLRFQERRRYFPERRVP